MNAALAAIAAGLGMAYLAGGLPPSGTAVAVAFGTAACLLSLAVAIARLGHPGAGRLASPGSRPRVAAAEPPRPASEDVQGRKMDFLTSVSHELRTPLTSIRGFLRLLEERLYAGEAEREEFFENSRFAAEHMLHVIDGTLQAARLDRHALVPRPGTVAGGDAAMQVVAMLDPLGREKNLLMRVEAAGAGLAHADPLLLRQVLINLVGNAIKFTDRGSVTVRVVERDGFIRFDVEDTGEGIDPAALEEIFVRFHQSPSAVTRAKGGIGIGLALSRQLVELMGGTMSARSGGYGRGACISFTLPAAAEVAPV